MRSESSYWALWMCVGVGIGPRRQSCDRLGARFAVRIPDAASNGFGVARSISDGDNDHYLAAVAEEDSAVFLIRSGLFLLRTMLETAPRPWGQVLSNVRS
jgi:hypothetical protein